jgi:hypothetical protein
MYSRRSVSSRFSKHYRYKSYRRPVKRLEGPDRQKYRYNLSSILSSTSALWR